MSNRYNSMAFTPEEVEAGLFQKFLDTLIHYNGNSEKHYCDIHITTDGYCTILEWDCVPFSHEWGGEFKHVDFDEEVVHEFPLPNGSYVRSRDEQEDKEIIEDFMHDNPDYEYDWIEKEWHKK